MPHQLSKALRSFVGHDGGERQTAEESADALDRLHDTSLPEGWRLLTAYEVQQNGLLAMVSATNSTMYICTVYPKAGPPVAATGSTPREAIANAKADVARKEEESC